MVIKTGHIEVLLLLKTEAPSVLKTKEMFSGQPNGQPFTK